MDKKLKQFVKESWDKIKKSKKSPKNYYVEIHPNGNSYIITKDNNKNGLEPEDWLGNLDILYQNRNITPEVVKKINTTLITKTLVRKISFNTNWVSPLAILLKRADFDKMTYTGNIKGVSKEQFTSIQNWVKSN